VRLSSAPFLWVFSFQEIIFVCLVARKVSEDKRRLRLKLSFDPDLTQSDPLVSKIARTKFQTKMLKAEAQKNCQIFS
jgi:hypothetical protein